MRYALLLHSREPEAGEIPADDWADMERLFQEYGRALADAGVLVEADILHGSTQSTTVTRRDGDLQVQDGPFAATKEALAGVFLLEVPGVDEALEWAGRCPGATYGTIEVRPAATTCIDGEWS